MCQAIFVDPRCPGMRNTCAERPAPLRCVPEELSRLVNRSRMILLRWIFLCKIILSVSKPALAAGAWRGVNFQRVCDCGADADRKSPPFEMFFEKFDILLLPTTPIAAPPIEGTQAIQAARRLTRFTAPFNLSGLPALSVPCGFTGGHLPIGLQIISRHWGEAKVLQAGHAFEQATEWRNRRPV